MLPDDYDEQTILAEAPARGIDLPTMGEFWIAPSSGPPTLLLGYGQVPEPAIRAAVGELAQAVHSARQRTGVSRP